MNIHLQDQNFFVVDQIATTVVAIATIVVFATIVVGVATIVVDCDNCEHCDNCDHIIPLYTRNDIPKPPL